MPVPVEFGHDIPPDKTGCARNDDQVAHRSVLVAVSLQHLLDGAGGGLAFDHVGQHDLAAVGLNDIATADVVGPIAALDEHLRQDFADEIARFVFVEEDHAVHGGERRQDERAVFLAIDRALVALVAFDRGITVKADTEASACSRAN